jgi:hypothetical protein
MAMQGSEFTGDLKLELNQKIRLSKQIVALMLAEGPATNDELLEVVRLTRWSVEAMQAETAQAQELRSSLRLCSMTA